MTSIDSPRRRFGCFFNSLKRSVHLKESRTSWPTIRFRSSEPCRSMMLWTPRDVGQEYVAEFSMKHDPIIIFGHFPIANSLDGLEKIIADPSPIRAALKRHSEEPEFRELALK